MSDSEYVIPINNLPVYFYLTDPTISLEESLGPPPISNPELRRTFRYYGSFSQDPDIVKVENMKDKYEKDRKLCRIYTMCDQNNSKGTWYHVELMKPNNHQNEIRSHAVSLFEAFQEEADENDFKLGPGYVNKIDHKRISCYLNWIINVENGDIEYYVSDPTYGLSYQYDHKYNHYHIIVRHIKSLKRIVINNILLSAQNTKNYNNLKLFYASSLSKNNNLINLSGGTHTPIRYTIFKFCCV